MAYDMETPTIRVCASMRRTWQKHNRVAPHMDAQLDVRQSLQWGIHPLQRVRQYICINLVFTYYTRRKYNNIIIYNIPRHAVEGQYFDL